MHESAWAKHNEVNKLVWQAIGRFDGRKPPEAESAIYYCNRLNVENVASGWHLQRLG